MSGSNDGLPGGENARTVEEEHRVQVELLEDLEDAIESQRDAGEVEQILDRFREFTRLHFLSEELLMRLHAYPQHEAHLSEHHRLVEAMAGLERVGGDGDSAGALDRVRSFKRALLDHIATQDEELTRFMAGR